MNLSYSYYNQYNDDPNDDLYNMAVAINNKNKQEIHPFFNTQGSFQDPHDDESYGLYEQKQIDEQSIDLSNMSKLSDLTDNKQQNQKLSKKKSSDYHDQRGQRANHGYHKMNHMDENSVSSEEEKIDHIKNCSQCKKKFLKLLRKSEKHVFPDDSDHDTIEVNYNKRSQNNINHVGAQPAIPVTQPVTPISTLTGLTSTQVIEQIGTHSNTSIISRNVLLILLIGIAVLIIVDLLLNRN